VTKVTVEELKNLNTQNLKSRTLVAKVTVEASYISITGSGMNCAISIL